MDGNPTEGTYFLIKRPALCCLQTQVVGFESENRKCRHVRVCAWDFANVWEYVWVSNDMNLAVCTGGGIWEYKSQMVQMSL